MQFTKKLSAFSCNAISYFPIIHLMLHYSYPFFPKSIPYFIILVGLFSYARICI